MSIESKLRELQIQLPDVANPVANYVPATRVGSVIYTSGQLPFVNGELTETGKAGEDVSPERAAVAARQAALNALAAAAAAAGGIDHIRRIVRLTGYVNSGPDFHGQPRVVNGASDLLVEIFGEAGRHARSAVGVAALPLNACVEIELIVETV